MDSSRLFIRVMDWFPLILTVLTYGLMVTIQNQPVVPTVMAPSKS
jgi:hypothetical protein